MNRQEPSATDERRSPRLIFGHEAMRFTGPKARFSTYEELAMRGLFAFLLGVAATIGAAYLHDTLATPGTQRFVNWDAVNDSARAAVTSARAQWDRLVR